MTDQQPRDRVREIIAITVAATDEAGVNAYEVAIAEGWTDIQPEWLVVADAILAALQAANLVIVEADRLERLRQDASTLRVLWAGAGMENEVDANQPGDLDPILPAAGEKGGES